MTCTRYAIKKQQGATLIVALVMLLVVTMVTLSGVQSSILQERLAANLRDHEIAFQAAEAALREGERARAGTPGFIALTPGELPRPQLNLPDATFWANARQVPRQGVARPPRFVTEELAFDSNGESAMIRVTAIGFGAREQTQVVLQSVVGL